MKMHFTGLYSHTFPILQTIADMQALGIKRVTLPQPPHILIDPQLDFMKKS